MWCAGWCFFGGRRWDRFSVIFWLTDVLEVGVLEEGWIFEPVAEQSVHGYVCDPDEGERGGKVRVKQVAGEQESEGKREGVDEIVERSPEARVQEIASHEEVGREKEDGEESPAVVQALIGEDGDGQEDGLLDAEQDGWAGKDVWP
jgi:hypothetical protein